MTIWSIAFDSAMPSPRRFTTPTGPLQGLRFFVPTPIPAGPTCARPLGPAKGTLRPPAQGRRQAPAELEDVAAHVQPLGVGTGQGNLKPPAGNDARHFEIELMRLEEVAGATGSAKLLRDIFYPQPAGPDPARNQCTFVLAWIVDSVEAGAEIGILFDTHHPLIINAAQVIGR